MSYNRYKAHAGTGSQHDRRWFRHAHRQQTARPGAAGLIAAISGPLSTVGWWLAKSRRRVALTNLAAVFPEKSEGEREAIARGTSAPTQAVEHGMAFCGTPVASEFAST